MIEGYAPIFLPFALRSLFARSALALARVISLLSPVIVFAAIWWSRLKASPGRHARVAALEAAVLLAGGLIFVTEALGCLHRLRPGWIAVTWTAATALAIGYLWREGRRPSALRSHLLGRLRSVVTWRPLNLLAACEVATITFALGATGLIAWLAPPTTFDAMTYQLPRVMHWFQQGTLEHFPTSNVRQIAYGPGASYWQTHLWALLDGDAGANLPQWLAYLGCALALSLWIGRFFSVHAVRFALVIGLTLPMAVLQASSTQTDLQVACWLLIGAVFLSARDSATISRASLAGLACGLAVVTKPSAALCVGPLACVALVMTFRRRGGRAGLVAASLWVAASLLVCLPHFVRNTRAFGQPLGDSAGTLVTTASPQLAVANIARWLTLNLPSERLWQGAADSLQALGLDPNHPAITFLNLKYSPTPPHVVQRLLLPDEDFVAYTTALALVVVLWLATRLTPARPATLPPIASHLHASWRAWLGALLCALALHCLLLKWQYWGNRLLLPCALLTLPALAVMTGAHRLPRLRVAVAGLGLLQTAALLTFSLNRPLVPLPASWTFAGSKPPLFSVSRTARFYAGYNAEAVPVARELVAHARAGRWQRVGLIVGTDYPEYVLWRALHDAGLDHVELHHFQSPPPTGSHPPVWPPAVDGVINVP